MPARIYIIDISHPANAAVGMLRHKRIPHRVVSLMPGLHPMLVRFAGFPRHTVPALEIDGHRVQGSPAIARHLDRLRPDPPSFPRIRTSGRPWRRRSAGASACSSRFRDGCSGTCS
jgi:glutathione S-transferase